MVSKPWIARASSSGPSSEFFDAGTGLGRDADLVAHNMTGTVYAIDASSSVFRVCQDLTTCENLNVVQADLTRLPFRQQFFDFISCDQVLHHTPDTCKSLSICLRNLVS
jgi:ubiquinone/menaquinone biosynthesis C-methylase UbiE